jgi:hypothetical protein
LFRRTPDYVYFSYPGSNVLTVSSKHHPDVNLSDDFVPLTNSGNRSCVLPLREALSDPRWEIHGRIPGMSNIGNLPGRALALDHIGKAGGTPSYASPSG